MENASTISRPYAQACFSFALEQADATKALDFWSEVLLYSKEIMQSEVGIDLLEECLSNQKPLMDFVLHCIPETHLTPEVNNFFSVVLEHSRFAYLPAIYEQFVKLRQNHDLATPINIISAQVLSAKQIEALTEKLAARIGKQVNLAVEVDPSIVSGIIIKYDDVVIDCSGRKYLNNLSVFLGK